MKIALDAMGGDHAPQEIVLGGLQALQQYPEIEKVFLVGQKASISQRWHRPRAEAAIKLK